jgi:anti-sigma factor RsiW
MKVDRHNYEDYFLLYVDNELTAEQKKQVELFIRENPDLEEELVMLQQSRLIPETIVFEEKHLLMKEANSSFISLSNYEEWLVLYVDNELSEEEKITVEKFVASHPHVQKELDLFEQTKLQPDQFNFPDKNLLYRNKKRVRIISMVWWRVAAAAILIIAAGITLYSVLTTKNSSRPEDKIVISQKEQEPNPVKSISPDQQQKQNGPALENQKDQVVISTAVEKAKQENKRQPEDNLPPSDKQIAKVNSNVPQRRPLIVNEINTTRPSEQKMSIVDVPGKRKQIFNGEDVTPGDSGTPNLPEYANNTENKKLRGLFRKATRFIERTSGINPANDDNKVLIGGMAINLK